MATYTVSIPIAGAIHIQVEAKSVAEAKEKAWDEINLSSKPVEEIGEIEWEFFDAITEGNVCHAPLNEIAVSKHREGKP